MERRKEGRKLNPGKRKEKIDWTSPETKRERKEGNDKMLKKTARKMKKNRHDKKRKSKEREMAKRRIETCRTESEDRGLFSNRFP